MVQVSGTVLFAAALMVWLVWLIQSQISSWSGSPRFYFIFMSPIGFLLAYAVLVYGPQVIG